MYFCYLDESGTPQLGAQTSHFILLGLPIPAAAWHEKDRRVNVIKARHGLAGVEIHTGYIARRFPAQEHIGNFEQMDSIQRRAAMQQERKNSLVKAAALKTNDRLKAVKKLYAKSAAYIHLTHAQRTELLQELADEIGSWNDTRLFAEAVEKAAMPPGADIFEKAFEQAVTRFHTFLVKWEGGRLSQGGSVSATSVDNFGLLIQDNNQTVAKNITDLMRRFHVQGTLWAKVERIIETPLFVDSSLTSMVQMADLCAYATRRFFENGEEDLFDRIFARFDRAGGKIVGIRHYVGAKNCKCKVCASHPGNDRSEMTHSDHRAHRGSHNRLYMRAFMRSAHKPRITTPAATEDGRSTPANGS